MNFKPESEYIAETARLRAQMQEAWKLVNAMAGQEYWDRAEDWLKANAEFAPSLGLGAGETQP